jgi:hypothetical protein
MKNEEGSICLAQFIVPHSSLLAVFKQFLTTNKTIMRPA